MTALPSARRRLQQARSVALTPMVAAFVASPRVRQHGPRALDLLRRLDPVHRSPLGITILSRHTDVTGALRDSRLGNDERKADPGLLHPYLRGGTSDPESGPFLELSRQLLLFLDPPDHTRLRRLVAKAFTPTRIERLRPRVATIVDELLAPAHEHGGIELMHEFAYPLPARVICELLGVPAADEPLFVRHAPALATGLDPSPMHTPEALEQANQATIELRNKLDELIAARRRTPGNHLLSALIAARDEDKNALSHDELVATVLLLILAGHETTANVLGSALDRLVRNPALHRKLAQGDQALFKTAVEEFLRLDGPVQMTQRVTLEPLELSGIDLPAGAYLVLTIAAANRDPSAFPNPALFDPARHPNPHLAFGGGAHYCMGAALARLELQVALAKITSQLPAPIRFAHPPRPRPSFTIRGHDTLHLSWTPARHA